MAFPTFYLIVALEKIKSNHKENSLLRFRFRVLARYQVTLSGARITHTIGSAHDFKNGDIRKDSKVGVWSFMMNVITIICKQWHAVVCIELRSNVENNVVRIRANLLGSGSRGHHSTELVSGRDFEECGKV